MTWLYLLVGYILVAAAVLFLALCVLWKNHGIDIDALPGALGVATFWPITVPIIAVVVAAGFVVAVRARKNKERSDVAMEVLEDLFE